jgi:hypothetical protein
MEFLVLFVALIIGAIAGWYIREYVAFRVLDQMLSKIEKQKEKELENSIRIKIEKHHGQLYVFEDETDKFLGQAADMDSLDKFMAKHYPGVKFFVKESNLESVGVEL